MKEKPPVFAVMEITPQASQDYGESIPDFFNQMRDYGYDIYSMSSWSESANPVPYLSQRPRLRLRELEDFIMIHRDSIQALRSGDLIL